jgi:outer membrane autotransporter protein
MTQSGPGRLTLTGANTYSGGTTISNGSLDIGIGGTTGSISGPIVNNSNLYFNRSDAYTYSGSISGTGDMHKQGSGVLRMDANVSQGSVSVWGGLMEIAGGHSLNVSSYIIVYPGAQLGLSTSSPAVQAGTVTAWAGSILDVIGFSGAGPHTLIETTGGITGNFTLYVGGAAVPAPGLTKFMNVALSKVNGDKDLVVDESLVWEQATNAHGTFHIAAADFELDYDLANNTIAGAGTTYAWDGTTLTKTGAGRLFLAGANTYTGSTTVSEGILEVTGTLGAGANYAGAIANAGEMVFNQAANQTLSGVVSGAGNLSKDDTGKLTLTGTNTYTGKTEVKKGTLALTGTGSLGNGGSGGFTLHGGATFEFSGRALPTLAMPSLNVNAMNGLQAKFFAPGKSADFTASNLNYIIPPSAGLGSILLNLDGSANVTGASIGLDTPSGRPNINLGEYLVLIHATEGMVGAPVTLTVQTLSGDIYTIRVSGDELQAVLEKLSPTGATYQRMKAFAESQATNLAFVNHGLDFILNRGFGSALIATAGPGVRFSTFGGMGGGWSRYRTGSHIDVSGLSLLSGVALGNDIFHGRLTLGAFFEGGWGSYNSYNSFRTAASVRGWGKNNYYGGGLLGRYDAKQGALSGLYAEGSARLGWTKTDFHTKDIKFMGWDANFESSSLYYGLHGGVGYVRKLTDKTSVDVSAKVLWTHQNSDSVTVHKDKLHLKEADSVRTRFGGRFNYDLNEQVTSYAGAYWEHEFDGKLGATVNNKSVASPSFKGDTGMVELGISLKPSKTQPLYLDLGVQGYVGKRQGVNGSLQIRYEF